MNDIYQIPGYMPLRNEGTSSCNIQSTMPTTTCSSGNDERLVGGFAFPFLLGGVTGAALAPAFWRPGYGYNRPVYYQPGPYYPYPPRGWF